MGCQLTLILCVVQGTLSIIQINKQDHSHSITALVRRELKDEDRNLTGVCVCVDEDEPITDGLHLLFFFFVCF